MLRPSSALKTSAWHVHIKGCTHAEFCVSPLVCDIRSTSSQYTLIKTNSDRQDRVRTGSYDRHVSGWFIF